MAPNGVGAICYNSFMADQENNSSDRVLYESETPLYLVKFLFKIKRHQLEDDFFVKRYKHVSLEDMIIETQMTKELFDRGLILLPENTIKKTFDETKWPISPAFTVTVVGKKYEVPYWSSFELTPLGKYFVSETIFRTIKSVTRTTFAALIGAAAALLVNVFI